MTMKYQNVSISRVICRDCKDWVIIRNKKNQNFEAFRIVGINIEKKKRG